MPSESVRAAAAASTAPLAAIMWPVIDLTACTGISFARPPRTCLMARVSTASFLGVPVPCALTQSMSAGASPASPMAPRMLATAPRPAGSGSDTR